MLTFVVIFLVRCVVELSIKGMVGNEVANKLAWVTKPAIVLRCFPCSRSLVARRIFVNIIAYSKALPSSVTIGCWVNSFAHVIRICERRSSIKPNQRCFPNIEELIDIFSWHLLIHKKKVRDLEFLLIIVRSPIAHWWKLAITVQWWWGRVFG